MDDINVPGLVAIIVFYLAILAVGVWAGRKKKMVNKDNAMLAGRSIGMAVGVFTMTATWVGGGYINGTSEVVFRDGLIWAQAPWAYSSSLVLGGLFFAKTMRARRYTTMIDPFQQKYGPYYGALLIIPAFLAEVMWCAAILNALGSTLSVVISLDRIPSVCMSAAIAVAYTLLGGLFSVAYTDILQLICMFIGLWLSVPFVLTNSAVSNLSDNDSKWLGSWDTNFTGLWIDYALQMIFGGIPWQAYFQRVLSSESPRTAQIMSYVGGFGCAMFAIPPLLIGAAGATTDWTQTSFNSTQVDAPLILPLALQYLTPTAVGFIGLGAVSAAVMSSTDSSVLSSSTMFTHNIYHQAIRREATECELFVVMRIAILCVGAIATTLAVTVNSIYVLFVLCSDLVYVILFPQLLAVIHMEKLVNTYGSAMGYIVGLVLRILGGETSIGLAITIKYPLYNETDGQLFPMRTFAMVCSLVALVVFSLLFKVLFKKGIIPMSWDFCHAFDDKWPNEYEKHQESQDKAAAGDKGMENIAMGDGKMKNLSFQSLENGKEQGGLGENTQVVNEPEYEPRNKTGNVTGYKRRRDKGIENRGWNDPYNTKL